jgi:hypothetical protein
MRGPAGAIPEDKIVKILKIKRIITFANVGNIG